MGAVSCGRVDRDVNDIKSFFYTDLFIRYMYLALFRPSDLLVIGALMALTCNSKLY